MSGTSADGIDCAVVAVAGSGLEMTARLLASHHVSLDTELKQLILGMRHGANVKLRDLASLARALALIYARAVNVALELAGADPSTVTAVAAHGQTLYHDPPLTLQWLDPALLAAETGCIVISDFRRADCAAGGQGAPLVPFADFILFRHPYSNRALLNIGGIANVTLLPAGLNNPSGVVAFDTGPGNCLSDHICRLRDPTGLGYDVGGKTALAGMPDPEIARKFFLHSYFAAPPPKSTDVPQMVAAFDRAMGEQFERRPIADLLSTACYITGSAILDAIDKVWGKLPDELIVSGGGADNQSIMGFLRASGDMRIRTTDELGAPAHAKEAVAFALLGAATLDGVPGNLPSVTGARRPVILGSITPRP